MAQIKKETLWELLFVIMMGVTILVVRFFYIREMIQLLFILVSFRNIRLSRGSEVSFPTRILMSRILFLTWCFCSFFWALYPDVVLSYLFSVIQSTLLLCAVVIYFSQNTQVRLKQGIQMFVFMSFVLAVYVFATFPVKELIGGTIKLEGRITARGINANQVGVCCSYSILILLNYCGDKKIKAVILGVPMLLVALLTGSKKALITLMFGSVFLAIAKATDVKKLLKYLAIVIVLIIGLLWAVYHVDFLYQSLGKRLDGLLTYILDGTGDKSTYSRGDMIELAIKLFLEHPLLGIGLHNFKSVNPYGLYAHNNFAEMLSCLGLPGFLLYYGVIGEELYYGIRDFFLPNHSIHFEIVLLLCFLMNEYATVSYTNEVIQIVLGLIFGIEFSKKYIAI